VVPATEKRKQEKGRKGEDVFKKTGEGENGRQYVMVTKVCRRHDGGAALRAVKDR
jgi:hypothetical protein